MQTQTITASQVFDGTRFHKNCRVTFNERIISIEPDMSEHDVTHQGILVPGFIDIQVNGGGGVLFNQTPTADALAQMFLAHARYGTTAMLPTFITDNVEQMSLAADAVAAARTQKQKGIIGIHFEGPHLSEAKKGAHSAQFIRPINDAEWRIFERQDLGQILVTLAPETVSTSDIERMVKLGIKVCLGHTNADFNTATTAVKSGASGFTHLFNAMSAMTSREPGVVGCALLHDNCITGLIVDGHHVDYASCEIAIKSKPDGKVILVTDAMPPVGTQANSFDFFDRTVHLNEGKLTSTTGELAGSVLDMTSAVRNCHQYTNTTLDKSLKMAALYPAQYLNIEHERGKIIPNMIADMVLLSDNLMPQATWVEGEAISPLE